MRKDSILRFALALSAAATLPMVAAGQTFRQEKRAFTATLTSFQTYAGATPARVRYIAANVHFVNNTDAPLTLAYSKDAFGASDEQGNRYKLVDVHGMGEASRDGVDAKFVLAPKRGADMLVELAWSGPRNVIYGVKFDLRLAVRELSKLDDKQFQTGPETLVEFTDLKTGFTAVSEGVPPLEDHVVDAGSFKAAVTRTRFGRSGRWQMIADLTVKLTNTSPKPLILACDTRSVFGSDNEDNVYGRGSASSTFIQATGIGLTADGHVDTQFVMAPGESREVHFSIGRSDRIAPGTAFTLHIALEQFEIFPSKQVLEVRQFSLTFPNIRM